MNAPVTCYPSPGKRKGLKLCTAFAAGCGGRVAKAGRSELAPGPAFFYGMTGHSLPLIETCRREGRDWYYADNAYYFGRGRYFRVTRNAFQHDGAGKAQPARFAAFGLRVAPWRRGGRHVLVTTQSELFYRLHLGTSRADWTRQVVERLRRHSDRQIVVCHKPDSAGSGNAYAGASFEADLLGAHALVTYSSSTAVKALMDGVPVFCTGPCMAGPMARAELSRIEDPLYPDGREPWLWTLAANQWTTAEMANGTCWNQMSEDRSQKPDTDGR